LEQLFATESFDPATATQSFRLAVSDYTVATLGPALVRSVLTKSPNSTVSCEVLDEHVFDRLDAGTLDVVIYGRVAPERYCSQHLFRDHFVCLVSAGHPLADQKSVSLSTYLRWPHLAVEIGQPWIDRALEPLGVTRRIAVSMPYFALAPSILPGTDLVLTVPARLAHQYADPARTHILAAPRELIELEFYAVWHPRFDQDPSHRWLREVVRAASNADG
jgi:DNA-binding transcriptional LysR family regulator